MIKSKDDTEQRAIIAILLSLAVYWVWQFFFPPPAPPPAPAEGPAALTGPVAERTPERATPSASVAASDADVPERELDFIAGNISARLSSEGGSLRHVFLPDESGPYHVTPICTYLIAKVKGEAGGEWSPYGEEPDPEEIISSEGMLAAAGTGRFVEGRYTLTERGDAAVAARVTADGVRVTKTFAPGESDDFLSVEVRFENAGSQSWSGPLWVGMSDIFNGEANRYSNVSRPTGVVDGDLETQNDLDDLEKGPEVNEGPVSWFGIGDRYFMAAAIPDNETWGQLTFASFGEEGAGAFLVRDQTLAPGQSVALNLKVYVGSKDLKALREVGHDFPDAVDFGFFGFFSNILLWILQAFHSLVGNWGASIILLTLSVKAAFWPLTQKSYASSRAMQKVQPKLNALKEKYGDNPQKMGEEQMKLFREEGVSPLSGCLPMVVQMPVWFALYSVLLSSADVYHAEFLYLRDLSSTDPVGLLPFLVGVFMLLQQRILPTSPTMDPVQQKMMRMMPLIFVVFMFAFPAGLNIYILVNTLLSITQMWLINRANPVTEPVATTT